MPKGKKRKKERGRPMERGFAPRVDATPEEIAQAMFNLPENHQWEYLQSEPDYRCSDCKREVTYPDTLYRDGRCETCHATLLPKGGRI